MSAAPLCSELLGTHGTALVALLLHSHQHQPRAAEGSRSPGDVTTHHRSKRIPVYTHPLHSKALGAKCWEGHLRKTAQDPHSRVKLTCGSWSAFSSILLSRSPHQPVLWHRSSTQSMVQSAGNLLVALAWKAKPWSLV